MDLHVLKSPNPENHIFSGWSKCVCLSVINITQKQIIAEILNLAFYIFNMLLFGVICYLKQFMKIEEIVCIQGHIKISKSSWPMDRISG